MSRIREKGVRDDAPVTSLEYTDAEHTGGEMSLEGRKVMSLI